MFPGGLSCNFKGKHVPCFIRWRNKGSMTLENLQDLFATLDHHNLSPCSNDPYLRLFALLDGHRSRIKYNFLDYVKNKEHLWVVCFWVPYGTTTWQVGNSKEQNGSFNMALGNAKSQLVKKNCTLLTWIY